jgi:hypothetical protein
MTELFQTFGFGHEKINRGLIANTSFIQLETEDTPAFDYL